MGINQQETWGGTVSLHLNRLNNVEIVEYKGKQCVILPIDDNGIFISDKGTIALSFFMSRMQEKKWDKTHELKRKLSGAEYHSMTKEQRSKQPSVGYFSPWEPKDNGVQSYQQTQKNKPTTNRIDNGKVDTSSLPF